MSLDYNATPAPSATPPSASDATLFPPTMWSAVVQANAAEASAALQALERLARAYWRPLHAFARQRGMPHHEAADAVQGFFASLCSKAMFEKVERRETRFRSFLLRCFTNYLSDQRDRAMAAKRGGGAEHVPLDGGDGLSPRPELPELVEGETPEHCFDHCWARALFDQALQRLDAELAADKAAPHVLEIRQRMLQSTPEWDAVAEQFDQKPANVRQIAARLRQRLAGLLREQVRALVSTESEVADELKYILSQL